MGLARGDARGDDGGHVHRPDRVHGAVARAGGRPGRLRGEAGPGRRGDRALDQGLGHLGHGEVREPGQHQGGHARHDAAGRARGADRRVAVRRGRHDQADPRGRQRHVGPRAAERGQVPGAVDGPHRDDARVGGRVVHPVRAQAVVARGRDQHHPFAQRVADRRLLCGAAARRGRIALAGQAERPWVKRQVDDPGSVIGRVPDALGDGLRQLSADGLVRGQRIVELQRHPDREDLRRGRDADQARPGLVAGDDAGHGGAVEAPVRAARGPAGAGVVGPGDHRAGQARVAGVDPGAEDGDGYPGSLGFLPRLRHLQASQPPFLIADATFESHGRGGGELAGGIFGSRACGGGGSAGGITVSRGRGGGGDSGREAHDAQHS